MEDRTVIIGQDPGDDFATLNAAFAFIQGESEYVDGTTNFLVRVRGPNSGGPSEYLDDYCDATGDGGYLITFQVEAYDPSDPPVFNGAGGGFPSPQSQFILANAGYDSGVPTTFKSSFTNITWQNYSIGSTQGILYNASGGSIDFTSCKFENITGQNVLNYYGGHDSRDGRTAVANKCFFTGSEAGIGLSGADSDIIIKNCVFADPASRSSGYFVNGGRQKVFNNSIYTAYNGGSTADIINCLTASNNVIQATCNGANIDGIVTGEFGGNVVSIRDTIGDLINGSGEDLGSNITTGTSPRFSDPENGDLSISENSIAAQNGIDVGITDSFNGVRRQQQYLRDGFLRTPTSVDSGAYEVTEWLSDRLKSGMISPTARLMLQTRDAATGSYPTMARTGDPDFSGKYSSKYDDTNTVVFSSNVSNVAYPMMLPSGTKFVKNDLLYPDYFDWDDRAIISNGNIRAGISDAHVSFTPGENISPFDESRIYLDNDSQFYMTGTASGTLPGFSQRLGSKTSISFELNNNQDHEVYFSTGSSAVSRHSGMSYFNFDLSRWETHGNLDSAAEVDIFDGDFQKGYLGFTTASPISAAAPVDYNDPRGVGYPISNFGFPYDARFEPTGSQLLSLSSSITAPFLLEKISLTFSGAFPASPISTTDYPIPTQFFILRQGKSGNLSELRFQKQAVARAEGVTTFTDTPITQSVDRELVSYGIISRFGTLNNSDTTDRSRDLNIIDATAAAAAITGTFRLDFPCRGPALNPGNALIFNRTADLQGTVKPNYLLDNSLATRGGFLSSGRSFIKSVGGFIPSSSILQLSSSNPNAGYHVPRVESFDIISPYVLQPNDSICLGFSNIPFGIIDDTAFGGILDETLSKARLALPESSFKVTLFGSLLQNNLPKESETNQPLTSDAVHEDLHYDNPVYDQWDVEPYSALSGSYVDLVITGSMIPDGERGVVASVVAGQAGTTGSLQRFVRLTDSVGKLYDSYPPDYGSVLKSSGVGYYDNTVGRVQIMISSGAVGAAYRAADGDSFLRFPFESVSKRDVSLQLKSSYGPAYDISDNLTQESAIPTTNNVALLVGTVSTPVYKQYTDLKDSARAGRKALFGFGRGTHLNQVPYTVLVNAAIIGDIRGYKYGLGGLFGSSLDVRFRREKYGQFRDMLEQRRYPATLVNNAVEYPVEIAFVERDSTTGGTVDPLQTHSQNLDTHASSSMPYFDGLTVDRSDNPDETLVPVEVS